LNIIKSDFIFDFHYLTQTGSYEWIYFDMISDCGNYSLVVIFYCGFPFSTRYNKYIRKYPNITDSEKLSSVDFPAISFCFYHKNKTIANIHRIFRKNKLISRKDEICIDKNKLITVNENGVNKYFLNINLDFPFRNLSIYSEIEISELLCLACDDFFTKFDENHFWSPRSPLTKVNTLIKIGNREYNFSGTGYSDRNYGTIPIFHNIREWYWGRFLTEKINVIYYHINYFNYQPLKILFLFDKDGNTEFFISFKEEFSRKHNYFYLNYFEEIKLKTHIHEINIFNVNKADNGPFYIRFHSDFNIHYKDNKITGAGFSEYISPQRLRWRFLHPFINIKLREEK